MVGNEAFDCGRLNPHGRPAAQGTDRRSAQCHLLMSLTRNAYNLVARMMVRVGRIVSGRSLFEAVWGFDREIEENTLDAFMHLLRKKIDNPGKPKLIHTVRGVGSLTREDGPA